MPYYRDWLTGEIIEIKDIKNYKFSFGGTTIIYKIRPSIAKEVSTD